MIQLGQIKKGILALTIANLIIGLVEFFFSLYLSRVLGAEGLGMLHLVTPINCLFLSFMTEGLVTTISKMSASLFAASQISQMHQTVKNSMVFSFFWSIFLVGIVILTAKPIAVYFLREPSLYFPILSTCPLMILMSISNIIKGHFLGLARVHIPSLINITEKLLRFPILYCLIRFLLYQTSFPTITLVYLCYAIGEIHSVFWLVIYYRWTKRNTKVLPNDSPPWAYLKPFISSAAPICMTQCLFELVNAFSSIVVKSRLCDIGYSNIEALELLGKYKGMASPLIGYPMIFIGSICAIVIPQVATLLETKKTDGANRLIRRALIAALLTGFVTALLFWFLGDTMGNLFYKRDDLGTMIQFLGLCAPLLYVTITSTNLLIGIGEEGRSFQNCLLQQLYLLIFLLTFVGIPALNIYGYIVAIVLSQLLLLMMNLSLLKKYT